MSGRKEPWTDLGGGVRVRQSRAFEMNSVLLLDLEHAVIVDPGVLPSELDELERVVHEAHPAQVTLFFTHGHWDHVLGRPWWPGARTVAHDRFAAEIRRERNEILREAESLAEQHGERWTRGFVPFQPDTTVSGLRFLPLGRWRLVLRDAPGHSASQLSCHLADRGLLIAADMLSDVEPPILDGPVAPFRATLDNLRVLAGHGAIETLVPGHGSIARGRERVLARFDDDLGYLAELDRRVRGAVGRGHTLAETQAELDGMSYPGRGSTSYPTGEFHRENVAFAYRDASS